MKSCPVLYWAWKKFGNHQYSQLSIYFGKSAETSDFIVDCLANWWEKNKLKCSGLKESVIDLDGGSATRSNRTQFIKRMVQFSNEINIEIRLIYYPPYHSKYNPIERCWAALENYWNGGILDSVEAAILWASNMTWQGLKPIVHCVETIYEKGVKVLPDELEEYKANWQFSNCFRLSSTSVTLTGVVKVTNTKICLLGLLKCLLQGWQ